jgi:hypothetical protein
MSRHIFEEKLFFFFKEKEKEKKVVLEKVRGRDIS